jgi:hypothetical protein
VFVTMNDRVTQQPEIVDRVDWSEFRFNRGIDEISEFSTTLPDSGGGVRCASKLGGLVPWRYGIRVERDAQLVWQGPVTGVTRPTQDGRAVGNLRVTANDIWARFKRRLSTRTTFDFVGDAAGLVRQIMNVSARLGLQADGFTLFCPDVTAGTLLARTVLARDFVYAWDILQELFDSAVDGYVMNGDTYLFEPGTGWFTSDSRDERILLEGPYDPGGSGELVYGIFTNESWIETPGWSISGWNQANTSWVPGADSGEEGFRKIFTAEDTTSIVLDGVLDFVDPNPLYRASSEETVDTEAIADETYQRRADSIVAQRAQAPAVMEGGSLSQRAPISFEHLRPGAIWGIDVHDASYGQLLQASRLKRIEVTVRVNDGRLEETISPTLFPVGYTESDF